MFSYKRIPQARCYVITILYTSRKVKNEAEIRIFYENKKWVKVEENTYKNQKMTAGEHQGFLMEMIADKDTKRESFFLNQQSTQSSPVRKDIVTIIYEVLEAKEEEQAEKFYLVQ